MKRPIAITFHGIAPADWVEADILKRAAKLDTYCRDIMQCHVTVDLPHRHHRGSNSLSVRIDLSVPGEELAVTRDASMDGADNASGDVRLVLREAFDVVQRRLKDYSQRRRLEVKRHSCGSGIAGRPDGSSPPS